jgi:hypothetical protein
MKIPEGKRNAGIILVETTGEPTLTLARLKKEHPEKSEHYWGNWTSDDVTDQTACTFNIRTNMYADNSVYKSSKGLYIKKDGKRLYLEDFE